jgi:glycogen operon protein
VSPTPGAHLSQGGADFAVRARDAERVTLCLFDGGRERRVPMSRAGDWHMASVTGVKAGQAYGYRAAGPWAPDRGHCFDETKLLVDPYAMELDRRFRFDPALCVRGQDTAALVPKALVMPPLPHVVHAPPRFRRGGLIYELNVRGFSHDHPGVPPERRGTVAALADAAVIAHLKKLHVGAVELMPIIAWIDERHLPPLGLTNAWGYNPVVPMALDPGLCPGGLAELRDTVAALHAEGIGVILDLVFNHPGESDAPGPTLSLRGLDGRWYAREADGTLINDTGTGNTLDFAQEMVRTLALDTLRHFVIHAGIDGFRFDLASVLGRGPSFDPKAPMFAAIAADPVLKDRVLIAEPWDLGPDGYQLGNFPAGWLEWNDRYRDDVRRFWRGDAAMAGALATRMTGSSDIFSGPGTRSVNFIAAHDGFTLADLVSYEDRHNEANGESNRDGHDKNYSWNGGADGPTTDEAVLARRAADSRALLATLFASRGTIMLTAGDEFGRSQQGNNNAYAQDNQVTWLDWAARDRALEDYVAGLAAFRAAHPELGAPTFLADADWRALDGCPMTPQLWEAPDTDGFELRLPGPDGLVVRVDRRVHECTLAAHPDGGGSDRDGVASCRDNELSGTGN